MNDVFTDDEFLSAGQAGSGVDSAADSAVAAVPEVAPAAEVLKPKRRRASRGAQAAQEQDVSADADVTTAAAAAVDDAAAAVADAPVKARKTQARRTSRKAKAEKASEAIDVALAEGRRAEAVRAESESVESGSVESGSAESWPDVAASDAAGSGAAAQDVSAGVAGVQPVADAVDVADVPVKKTVRKRAVKKTADAKGSKDVVTENAQQDVQADAESPVEQAQQPVDTSAAAVSEAGSEVRKTRTRRVGQGRASTEEAKRAVSADAEDLTASVNAALEQKQIAKDKSRRSGRSASTGADSRARGEGEETSGQDDAQSRQRGRRQGAETDSSEAAKANTRTRQRDRKRRGADEFETEIAEDDVLLPVAGVLDVLDNYAFVRTSGYLAGASDVYVSLGQVRKYGLRRGDAVVGAIRQPKENEANNRQKYNALVKLDTINSRPFEEGQARAEITALTHRYPDERLRLDSSRELGAARLIDLVAPIGLGQRALYTLPVASEGAVLFAQLAQAIAQAKPEAHIMVVLTAARPEDAALLSREIPGETVAAPYGSSIEEQITIAELSLERAHRLTELGHDVVLLIDSLTGLAAAYEQAHGASARAQGSAELFAKTQVLRLFATASNYENSGSLTMLATVRKGSGRKADKQLTRELSKLANSELEFAKSEDPESFNVVLEKSRTVNAQLFMPVSELAATRRLKQVFANESQLLSERVQATRINQEILVEVQRLKR